MLDVRFPMIHDSGPLTPACNVVYCMNHPECVRRILVEERPNPPTGGAEG